jgi:hypothetical protein
MRILYLLIIVCTFVIPAALMTGCSIEGRPSGVPSGAERVAVGTDLKYRTPSRGMIYVYDNTNKSMVYSGRVVADDRVEIDAKDGDVSVNGHEVARKALVNGREYELWLDVDHH